MNSDSGGFLNAIGTAIIGVVLLPISLLGVPYVLRRHRVQSEARRESMASESGKLGLTFSEGEDTDLVARLSFLAHLEEGLERYALNSLQGEFDGYAVRVFDYHYKKRGVWWWAPSWYQHRYYSFITLQLEKEFPELLLRPDRGGPFQRVGNLFSPSATINFDSREFSERYDVRCENKKFAYDFCHARMIEYLMSKPLIPIELENNVITIGFKTPIPASRIRDHIEHLIDIRQLMPGYLFES